MVTDDNITVGREEAAKEGDTNSLLELISSDVNVTGFVNVVSMCA